MHDALHESFEGSDSTQKDGYPAANSVATVYIVSDIRFYRDGLVKSLMRMSTINVLGAGSSRDVLGQITSLRPDVLLLDVTLDNVRTLLRSARLLVPTLRIVALAVAEVEDIVLECAEVGICGYVSQDGSVEDVAAAVSRAVKGELACSPRIAAALFNRLAALSSEPAAVRWDAVLTPREQEIAGLLVRGLSNKEIARRLNLEPTTIKNHVHNILQKLNLRRRGEIATLRLDAEIARTPRDIQTRNAR